nr:C4-type zinc ribbon domain-containing protein [Microlunatus speluncae]
MKAEADLEPVRQRLARDQERIADGTVADPRQLESLIAEVDHLQKRISDLEDSELEIMEKLETATARANELTGKADQSRAEVKRLTGERDAKVTAINSEAAERKTERSTLQPDLPADLITLYERIRGGHGGVGAAELRNRRCTGCQLEINAAELREFAAAPADEVLRCEECSRILVRTEHSGL